ncbi:hypothetical protein ACKVMT_11080 [Halobacteriales archaeon Cl-PHB]
MASADDPDALEGRQRTVTTPSLGHENLEMDYVGWAIFAGLLVIMVPLLPVLVVVWVVAKLLGGSDRD